MNIPNFSHTPVIGKDGKFTDEWAQIIQGLLTQLNTNASEEGLHAPQQTTDNITKLNTTTSTSSFVYDKDTNQMKVNINGVFKVIPTMP